MDHVQSNFFLREMGYDALELLCEFYTPKLIDDQLFDNELDIKLRAGAITNLIKVTDI
jgi:hypothetical protein